VLRTWRDFAVFVTQLTGAMAQGIFTREQKSGLRELPLSEVEGG
jgi:hypothetical protein